MLAVASVLLLLLLLGCVFERVAYPMNDEGTLEVRVGPERSASSVEVESARH